MKFDLLNLHNELIVLEVFEELDERVSEKYHIIPETIIYHLASRTEILIRLWGCLSSEFCISFPNEKKIEGG